ncbi:MAG: hypothetical protein AAF570_27560, partial [Bacteroidota bacterium]
MDPHQEKLIAAAESLGITVTDLSEAWQRDAVRYTYQGQSQLVLDGRIYGNLSHHSELLADDKHVTKLIFEELGIPAPPSVTFKVADDADEVAEDEISGQIGDFFVEGKKYVCKPVFGTDGHAVGMHLDEMWRIEEHVDEYRDTYMSWMLEEQIEGEDVRIQAVGGKLVAACVRKPAYVTGDGEHTLDELIELHNEKIAQQNPNNRLEIDAAARQLMRDQNLFLSSVVPSGQRVVMKHVSNMGQGGVAEDVTDTLHPRYHEWVAAVAQKFDVRAFAFDAMSTDITADPVEHAHAIEINVKAQWLHHTFSEVRQHD